MPSRSPVHGCMASSGAMVRCSRGGVWGDGCAGAAVALRPAPRVHARVAPATRASRTRVRAGARRRGCRGKCFDMMRPLYVCVVCSVTAPPACEGNDGIVAQSSCTQLVDNIGRPLLHEASVLKASELLL